MKIKIGNIFDYVNELDYVGITTNSTLNKKGELVMGAGNAKEAKCLYPDLPKVFGQMIKSMGCELGYYGIIHYDKFIAVQTKRNWRDKSLISDVEETLEHLKIIAEMHPELAIGIPYPAINHGGLTESDIYPLLLKLPDNVIVYKLQ